MRFAPAVVVIASALSASRLFAAPVQVQPLQPKRTVEARKKIRVRVVAGDGVNVPDALDLRIVPGIGSERLLDRGELVTALAGAKASTVVRDQATAPDGLTLDLPPSAREFFFVAASAPGLYGEQLVDASESDSIAIELHQDRSLAVHVSDARGRSIGRVPVAIVDNDSFNGPDDLLTDPVTTFHAVVATRDGDGVATFDHVQEWIDANHHGRWFALLAVPHREHKQVELTFDELESGRVELSAPGFGSVEMRFPGVRGATVRLRERPSEAPADDDEKGRRIEPGEWRFAEPLELEVVDGVARCDRIGPGCTLELQARWRGLATPFDAEFAGPDRAGANVVWSLAPEGGDLRSAAATIGGRLLLDGATPYADRMLCGRLLEPGEDAETEQDVAEQFSVATDRSGRFELVMGPRRPTRGGHRWLHLFEAGAADDAKNRVEGFLDLDVRLDAGPRDLGDRLLVGPDSKERIQGLRDDALISECQAASAWPYHVTSRDPVLVRWNEMARRGGPGFVALLQRMTEVDLADEHEAREERAVNLCMALLLRRAQRKPMPIVLEPSTPLFEATTPSAPDVSLLVKDVDAGFERISVDRLDDPCWQVAFEDAAGHALSEPDDFPMVMKSGIQGGRLPWKMSFGDVRDDTVPVGRVFEQVRPGDYHVRIDYRIDDSVYLSSGDLVVRIRALPIHVTRGDYDAMVSWIRAIDVTKPVCLTWRAVDPKEPFLSDPETPEDRLARCGPQALPALLDELAETTDDPRRRAWILGLLWNTQLARSITREQIEAATGNFGWRTRWPTVVPDGDESIPASFQPGRRGSDPTPAAPDVRVQRDLAATWGELRGWFEITIDK